MPSVAATPRRLPVRRLAVLLLATCAACGGAPQQPVLGELRADQLQALQAAEAAYRADPADPAQRERAANVYQTRRDALAKDPVAAAWLTRMFIRDLFAVREGRPVGEDEGLFRAAAKIADPVETRALAEIRTLGAAAVPTLLGDLLRNEQPQPRELGIELLGVVGAPAAPAVLAELESREPRQRRAAARALGRIGPDPAGRATLLRLAEADGDFTVRADAVRALGACGSAVEPQLRQRLAADPDPFVRRTAAQVLANASDQASLRAIVDFLERCERETDRLGEKAAQKSLEQALGSRGPRTAAAWRQAIDALPAGSLPRLRSPDPTAPKPGRQ